MKKYIVFTLILFISYRGYGQQNGIFKGKIIEQATKQPIIGAIIALKNKQKGAVSDTLGEFTITDIVEGEYTITASCIGFQPKEINDIIINTGKNKLYRN
jgi:hypothetical protein